MWQTALRFFCKLSLSGEMVPLQIGTDRGGLCAGPYVAQTLFACLMVEGWWVLFAGVVLRALPHKTVR